MERSVQAKALGTDRTWGETYIHGTRLPLQNSSEEGWRGAQETDSTWRMGTPSFLDLVNSPCWSLWNCGNWQLNGKLQRPTVDLVTDSKWCTLRAPWVSLCLPPTAQHFEELCKLFWCPEQYRKVARAGFILPFCQWSVAIIKWHFSLTQPGSTVLRLTAKLLGCAGDYRGCSWVTAG